MSKREYSKTLDDKEMTQAVAVANDIHRLFLTKYPDGDAMILIAAISILQEEVRKRTGISVSAANLTYGHDANGSPVEN